MVRWGGFVFIGLIAVGASLGCAAEVGAVSGDAGEVGLLDAGRESGEAGLVDAAPTTDAAVVGAPSRCSVWHGLYTLGDGRVETPLWTSETVHDDALRPVEYTRRDGRGALTTRWTRQRSGAVELEAYDDDGDGTIDRRVTCALERDGGLTRRRCTRADSAAAAPGSEEVELGPRVLRRDWDSDGDGAVDSRKVTLFDDEQRLRAREVRFSFRIGGAFVDDLIRRIERDESGRAVAYRSERAPGGPGRVRADRADVVDESPRRVTVTTIAESPSDRPVVYRVAWDDGCYGTATGGF